MQCTNLNILFLSLNEAIAVSCLHSDFIEYLPAVWKVITLISSNSLNPNEGNFHLAKQRCASTTKIDVHKYWRFSLPSHLSWLNEWIEQNYKKSMHCIWFPSSHKILWWARLSFRINLSCALHSCDSRSMCAYCVLGAFRRPYWVNKILISFIVASDHVTKAHKSLQWPFNYVASVQTMIRVKELVLYQLIESVTRARCCRRERRLRQWA